MIVIEIFDLIEIFEGGLTSSFIYMLSPRILENI